ncbi:hypothetical protein TSAR_016931 [Trichomalopsis sarcophagae]|uniref:Uncharacterized protein n=1 Tax=Trichomalopsis sarcophagae TaxID=543379 RepID=A0A232F0C9_9HYME|nr:hypothetical protein TSAR_016931 [Trichomalopsis sarcophagae]
MRTIYLHPSSLTTRQKSSKSVCLVRATFYSTTSLCSTENASLFLQLPSKKLILGACYFQPKSDCTFFKEHSICVEQLSLRFKDHKFVIACDFYLPYLSSAEYTCSTYFTLKHIQHLPFLDSKGYSLDLLFAPNELVPSLDLQSIAHFTFESGLPSYVYSGENYAHDDMSISSAFLSHFALVYTTADLARCDDLEPVPSFLAWFY